MFGASSRIFRLVRRAAQRNCSGSSSGPKSKEEFVAEVDRNVIAGAVAGATLCVAARLKRETDDKEQRSYSSGSDFVLSAAGGAIAGIVIGAVWTATQVGGTVIAAVIALDWLDLFPAILGTLRVLRHGEKEGKRKKEVVK